jgi:hypothetical protein
MNTTIWAEEGEDPGPPRTDKSQELLNWGLKMKLPMAE